MKENWRTTLPLPLVVAIFVAIYLLVYLGVALASACGIQAGEEWRNFRTLLFCLFAIVHGGFRVISFHPFYDSTYRKWLSVSPWSLGHPLPKGPVHLIWTDVLMLAALFFLTYSNDRALAYVPPIFFLVTYLIVLNLTFVSGHRFFPAASLFIAPLVFYSAGDLYTIVVVFAILYILARVGLYRYFRDFPWNTDYWNVDLVEEMRQHALRQRMIGWPFRFLRVFEAPRVTVTAAFVISLLVVWWLHAMRIFHHEAAFAPLLGGIGFNAALYRAFIYAGIYRPPISILGRLATGRLIIPRYDKVFIAPVCILLSSTVLPLGLFILEANTVYLLEGSMFLTVFLTLALPPRLKDWQLTGAYRISNLATKLNQQHSPPPLWAQKVGAFLSQPFMPTRQT